MSTTRTSTIALAAAESRLEAAGIVTTPVEGCNDVRCPWCERAPIPLAA